MGYGSRAILAGGLGFAVSFVVACGSGNGLLTSDQANGLNNQLASVSSAVQAGRCGAASSAAVAFSNAVANLPRTVNTTLLQNLADGATTVGRLAPRDCQKASRTSSTSSSTTPTSTSTSTTTSTTTSSPTTTTSSSTTTSPTSTTATNPPPTSTSSTSSNGGAGIGGINTQGNGNGNGNGQ